MAVLSKSDGPDMAKNIVLVLWVDVDLHSTDELCVAVPKGGAGCIQQLKID